MTTDASRGTLAGTEDARGFPFDHPGAVCAGARVTEEVRWTAAGKAALAETHGSMYRETPAAELTKLVFAVAEKHGPAWKRGLAKADDEGRAAATLAEKTIVAGKLPEQPSVDDAARLLSLLGSSSSGDLAPLGELIIRAQGLPFAMAVLATMWSHHSASSGTAICIRAIEDDDDSVHDATCSYAKSDFTRYLERRYRASPAAERREMKQGVTAIWKTATPHARPALAYATRDPKRAKQSALELIEAGESPWPYFAWDHLPYIIDDAELALRILDDRNLSVDLIQNLGTAVWPLYEERITGHRDGTSRAGLLRDFSNFYGPKTALVIAEYEDTKECAPIVRAYFTLYPELRDKVIDEPALKYHREDLEKLRVDRPVPARRRS